VNVLLTGASGFVGSHVLDCLVQRGIPVRALLRGSSSRRFIGQHLPELQICEGTIDQPGPLASAMKGVTHVIHCAGLVKALRIREFYAANQLGTRHVVAAANAAGVRRLVHVSSLAAAGPGTAAQPARESDVPRPVSEYGRSKLAGEQEVAEHCTTEFVILRPPAVYGPRDGEFLRLFKSVNSGILPDVGCGRQPLSLVFVEDLARVIVDCLDHPRAPGKVFFVANPEIQTAGQFGALVAKELQRRPLRIPLPVPLLWPVCWGQELISRLTRRANVLSAQKYAELRAPGWVCDGSRLKGELGLECPTALAEGVRRTAVSYRQDGWL
jgi:nucleoside-diphosphate-sugar epimerase